MRKIFIGIAGVIILALLNTSCATPTSSAATEQVTSFIGITQEAEGTIKTVPGNVYTLGSEALPGEYIYTPVDEQTVSVTCHGLVFQFVGSSGEVKLVLPGGQTTGKYPKFEVQTTSCHFEMEFPPSGQKLLTIYR